MAYLGVSPSGSLQRSQPRCHLGLQVASHGLIGAGCASQFTQRVLAGLSSSQAIELRPQFLTGLLTRVRSQFLAM